MSCANSEIDSPLCLIRDFIFARYNSDWWMGSNLADSADTKAVKSPRCAGLKSLKTLCAVPLRFIAKLIAL